MRLRVLLLALFLAVLVAVRLAYMPGPPAPPAPDPKGISFSGYCAIHGADHACALRT